MTPDTIRFDLQRLDAEIRLELELIGQRMSWLSISHSFMFSAFTLEVVSDASAATGIRVALRHIIPLIGLISATCGGLSIHAAHVAGEVLRQERDRLERRGVEEVGAVHHRAYRVPRWITRLGNLPPRVMPWTLVAIWSLLLSRVVG